ncbi:hypothetical protein PR048_009420 [Dryococelus australis]|uniref:Uncharacterized protein n=1 Tax=Dryococelus australis TaxID=614101 RepID=A0ABQ9I0X6_9NEOP|nr:hypothetical protein PR048_009420 [Dryococelus australis]
MSRDLQNSRYLLTSRYNPPSHTHSRRISLFIGSCSCEGRFSLSSWLGLIKQASRQWFPIGAKSSRECPDKLQSNDKHDTKAQVFEGCGGVVSRHFASRQGDSGSIPGGITPGLSHVGLVPDDAVRWRVLLGDLPFPPPLHSGAVPHIHLTTVSSALKTRLLRTPFAVSLDRRMNKVMRPMTMLILHKKEEYTTCIQVEPKQTSANFTVNGLYGTIYVYPLGTQIYEKKTYFKQVERLVRRGDGALGMRVSAALIVPPLSCLKRAKKPFKPVHSTLGVTLWNATWQRRSADDFSLNIIWHGKPEEGFAPPLPTPANQLESSGGVAMFQGEQVCFPNTLEVSHWVCRSTEIMKPTMAATSSSTQLNHINIAYRCVFSVGENDFLPRKAKEIVHIANVVRIHWIRSVALPACIQRDFPEVLLCESSLIESSQQVLRAGEDKASWTWISAELQGREKRETPEKTYLPVVLSDTIPTCENPETEPGDGWYTTSGTTTFMNTKWSGGHCNYQVSSTAVYRSRQVVDMVQGGGEDLNSLISTATTTTQTSTPRAAERGPTNLRPGRQPYHETSMSRQSQCSRVLQAPSRTVGFTRRFHTVSSIQATNISLAVVPQSPSVVHTSLHSRTLGQTASINDCRPLGCGSIYSVLGCQLESSPTLVMRRGGLRCQPVSPEHSCVVAKRVGNSSRREEVCDARKSRHCRNSQDSQKEIRRPREHRSRKIGGNRIRLERASQNKSSDTHKTPYDRVKRYRERKINIKASERVNVEVFTQNKRPCPQHSQTQSFTWPARDPFLLTPIEMAQWLNFGLAFGRTRPMRAIEVSMEQRRNERTGETGDPLGNPLTNGINSHPFEKYLPFILLRSHGHRWVATRMRLECFVWQREGQRLGTPYFAWERDMLSGGVISAEHVSRPESLVGFVPVNLRDMCKQDANVENLALHATGNDKLLSIRHQNAPNLSHIMSEPIGTALGKLTGKRDSQCNIVVVVEFPMTFNKFSLNNYRVFKVTKIRY